MALWYMLGSHRPAPTGGLVIRLGRACEHPVGPPSHWACRAGGARERWAHVYLGEDRSPRPGHRRWQACAVAQYLGPGARQHHICGHALRHDTGCNPRCCAIVDGRRLPHPQPNPRRRRPDRPRLGRAPGGGNGRGPQGGGWGYGSHPGTFSMEKKMMAVCLTVDRSPGLRRDVPMRRTWFPDTAPRKAGTGRRPLRARRFKISYKIFSGS